MKSGRSLSDAVTDAIEALPASKSRDLRRWLEDWEAWEEWLTFKAKGWRVRSIGKGILVLVTPDDKASSIRTYPTERVVAAAAGVRAVKDARSGWERFESRDGKTRYDRVYEVVSGA